MTDGGDAPRAEEARAASDAGSQPWALDAIHLFALCGFAVAQPLFDLLGKNPTFFVAHDLDGRDVVLFALGLVVVPPLVLFTVLLAARLISATAARFVRDALVGTLVALTLLPPVERALGLSTVPWVGIGLAAATAAAVAYDRVRGLHTFATFLTPAPVLFLVVFLFLSPVHTIVTASDPAAAAVDLQGTQTPVVVLALDEFPAGILLDESGGLDAARYPGFARLAETSTWYSNTTTVSLQTPHAIPAILTGRIPVGEAVPVAAAHPRSLFTLLGRTHRLHAEEPATQICPESLCRRGRASARTASLTDDLEVVYLHSALPSSLAREWLPEISNRWSGFGEDANTIPSGSADRPERVSDDFFEDFFDEHDVGLDRFETFLASIDRPRRGEQPGLWFLHSLLPHAPYTWLPDGHLYTHDRGTPGLKQEYFSSTWGGDPDVVAAGLQRLVLQTKFVDRLVAQLLDRLEATGLLDDALVVVTADHGAVFLPNNAFRAEPLDAENKHHVLPVPLFMKYPGQTRGEIDDRDARTIDILPTIVDTFDADVPSGWSFDGRSLLGAPRHRDTYQVLQDAAAEDLVTVPGPVDAGRLAALVHAYLGTGGRDHDGFRFGPYGALVGEDAAALATGGSSGTIRADDWDAFDTVDLGTRVPALLEATLTGIDPGEWLAVAVNGTIAGLGPTYAGSDGATRTTAMLDDTLFEQGANRVEVYLVEPGAPSLRPITRR